MSLNRLKASPPQDELDVFASSFAATCQEFAQSFLNQMVSIHLDEDSDHDEWRHESCGALWSAIQISLAVSTLSNRERQQLSESLLRYTAPFWLEHCARGRDVRSTLDAQAQPYLQRQQGGNLITSAHAIVALLMARAGLARVDRPMMGRNLATLLAHRMFVDVRRIDEFKTTQRR